MKSKNKLPTVTIITPNWNGGNQPLEFINSIKKLNYPQDKIQIIIIDNGSQDNSPIQIAKIYPDVKLICLKQNLGFSPAVNIGIKKAKGKFIFIGNDDLVMEKNSLRYLLNYLQKSPKTGIVGGKIYFKNKPKVISSCGQRFNFITGSVSICKNPNKKKEVDWVQGCALLFPRTLINQIGLLDDKFTKIYFEDFDLCLRAKKAGYKIVYYPKAIFYHGQSTTMDKIPDFKLFQWYKNKIRFILKHLKPLNIVSTLFFQFILLIPYNILVIKNINFKPFFKALSWNYKHLKQTLNERCALQNKRRGEI